MTTPYQGGGDVDPRSHRSFLIKGYEVESLGNVDREKKGALNALAFEADFFADDELRRIVNRHIALECGTDGNRAKLMAGVAVHDEALRMVEPENRTGREERVQPEV